MKQKLVLLAVTLIALVSVLACNKQKAPRLDYTKKMESGLFSPNGMPGENHIGATDEEKKFQGYDDQLKAVSASKERKPASEEAKPAPAEEKKPSIKEVTSAPAEGKRPEKQE